MFIKKIILGFCIIAQLALFLAIDIAMIPVTPNDPGSITIVTAIIVLQGLSILYTIIEFKNTVDYFAYEPLI
jgi:hypothetical protein